MHDAWKAKWGSGFKDEQEMVDFLTSLQVKAPGPRGKQQQNEDKGVEGEEQDVSSVFKRWLSIGKSDQTG